MSASLLPIAAVALMACTVVAWGAHAWFAACSDERLARSLGGAPQEPFGAGVDHVLGRAPFLRRVVSLLREGDLGWRLAHVLTAWVVLAYPTFALLQGMYGVRLALVLTVVGIPGLTFVLLRRLVSMRRERYRRQVLDLVRHLAGSARAGLSVSHALTAAADELGDPIAGELRYVVLSMEFGALPEDALDELRARSKVPETGLLVNAIVIQQRSGGDLVTLLTRLAAGMEAFGRGRTEAAGIVAGVASMPWTVLALTLTTLFLVNRIADGVLDRLHQWPALEAAFYASLLVLVALIPLMKRATRLEPPG
jgi:tight adherence protein B